MSGTSGARPAGLLLSLVVPMGDWTRRANCLGVDPELFFPERGASTREAKEVCRGCEVRLECLEYAIAAREKHGIWGGLSERERRRVRRGRREVQARQPDHGDLRTGAA